MDVYERIGVRPIINARGMNTMASGSLMPKPVLDAMTEAAGAGVQLAHVDERAGAHIARLVLLFGDELLLAERVELLEALCGGPRGAAGRRARRGRCVRIQKLRRVEANVDHHAPPGRVLADEPPPDQDLRLVARFRAGIPETETDLVAAVEAARERRPGQRPDLRVAQESPTSWRWKRTGTPACSVMTMS